MDYQQGLNSDTPSELKTRQSYQAPNGMIVRVLGPTKEDKKETQTVPLYKKRKPPKVNATGRVLTSKGSIQSVNYNQINVNTVKEENPVKRNPS